MKNRDILSLQFEGKNLTKDNFKNAIAGHRAWIKIRLVLISLSLFSFLCIIPIMSGLSFKTIYVIGKSEQFKSLIETSAILIHVFFVYSIVSKKLWFKVGATNIILIISSFIIFMIFGNYQDDFPIGAILLILGFSITLAWIASIVTAFFIVFLYTLKVKIGELVANFTAILIILVFNLLIFLFSDGVNTGWIVIIEILPIVTGSIIARQAIKGLPQFAWLRQQAVFWAATGGTSFYGTNLTEACFDYADLKHTDFRKADLTRASFYRATGLELARLEGTILENPKVRKLLVDRLGGAENFTGLNLNGANLRGADLREAILVKTQLLDADLSEATLTDACIQDWNINTNTRFHQVECDRIYLKCSSKDHFFEPKPDSGKFKPGEFEQWVTDIRDTIDLIFQNGLNLRAFAFSLAQTAINNENLDLSICSIENKGNGLVIVRVGVATKTNKTAVHGEIINHYENAVQAIEAKYQLVLEAKDCEIARLTSFHDKQQQFLQGLVTTIAESKEKVQIQGENNRIYVMESSGDIMESKKTEFSVGGNISIGGDNMTLTGANISLGELDGQVSNTIQQLQGVNAESGNDLAKILTALQGAVNSDGALSESQKKEALEAIETLAQEGQKAPPERAMKYCTMALNALKGVTGAVSDASKLAEILKVHLPTLTHLLGI